MIVLSRRFLAQAALVHLAFALILNLPSLSGKVPLPVWIVNGFPPWEGVPQAEVEWIKNGPVAGDLVTQIYPWREFAAASLKKGELPAWNPHLLGGTPFIANAQSAVFYPLNWLYLLVPVALAWTLLFIVHTGLAGLFATILARRLGADPPAAICGGIVFTTSGFVTAWRGYPIGDSSIWLPLALFGVLRLAERPVASSVVLAAVAFSMPVLAGHPETAAHIGLTAAAFAVFLWFRTPSDSGLRKPYTAMLGCAILLSLGLAAAQMLPTVEWLAHTSVTLDSRHEFKPLDRALAFVSRDLPHNPNDIGLAIPEDAAYAGIISLVLAPIALLAKPRGTPLFFAATVFVAGGIVYGIDPFHWLSTMTPILSGLKNGRLLLVVDLSLAILASIGMSHLAARTPDRRDVFMVLLAVAISGWGLWRVHELHQAPVPFVISATFTAILLCLGLVTILFKASSRLTPRIFSGILFLLVAIDCVTASYGFVSFVPREKVYPPSPVFDFLNAHTTPGDRVASLDSTLPDNVAVMYGFRSLDGSDMELRTTNRLLYDLAEQDFVGVSLHSSKIASLGDRRLDMMAVRYLVVTTAGPGPERLAAQPERYSLVFSYGGVRIFENRLALKPASLISLSNIEIVPAGLRQLARIKKQDFAPESSAVLSSRPGSFPAGATAAGSAAVREISLPSQHQIRVKADAVEPSVLVLSEISFPGWTVKVDGVTQPVLQPNYALMGVALGAGAHEVLFEYKSRTVLAGMATSFLSILLCGALWVHGRKTSSSKAAIIAAAVVAVSLVVAATTIERPRPVIEGDVPPLELSRSEVIAGKESYKLRIESLAASRATLRYSIDGEEPLEYTVSLDPLGEIDFAVPAETRRGTYRMLAFRKEGDSVWTNVDASIVVK